MASTTVSILSATLAGAAITSKGSVASSETVTISPTTAQGSIDFSNTFIRVENQSSTAAVTLSLGAGSGWSSVGQGAYSISVATATTVLIGGQGFEGARFLATAGTKTITFTQSGAGPTAWEAYTAPGTLE